MHNLQTSQVLFRKEFRDMRRELFIIFAVQVAYYFFTFFFWRDHGPRVELNTFELFLIHLGNNLFYLYPALLVYSLYMESRNHTLYQALWIPVGRSSILRTKFDVVLTGMIFASTLLVTYVMIYFFLGARRIDIRVVIGGFIQTFSGPFIALCLVCAVWGVIQIVISNRHIFAVCAGVAGYVFYLSVMIFIDRLVMYKASYFKWPLSSAVTILAVGLVFYVIGMVFYEEYGEV